MLTKMPDCETSVLIILSFHILSTLINNHMLWFVVLVRMWIVLFITKLLYDWTVMIYFRNRQVLLKFLNLCYLILSSPSLKQNSDITWQFRWNVNSFHGKEKQYFSAYFFFMYIIDSSISTYTNITISGNMCSNYILWSILIVSILNLICQLSLLSVVLYVIYTSHFYFSCFCVKQHSSTAAKYLLCWYLFLVK